MVDPNDLIKVSYIAHIYIVMTCSRKKILVFFLLKKKKGNEQIFLTSSSLIYVHLTLDPVHLS